MERTVKQGDAFPVTLFSVYVLFYAGQAIYNTYLNLYLASTGLSDTQIGMTVSVSTAFLLCAQVVWGVLSDRARVKNTILLILYGGMAVSSLLFYLGRGFAFLLGMVTLFSVFINSVVPLQDNYTLEVLETKKWDFGRIRMGGTIGYSLSVLIIGFCLEDDYAPIFWMIALCMGGCFLFCRALPPILGRRGQKREHSYKELLQNKTLLGLILFNLAFSSGLNFFYNFYPIYYTSLGGDSSGIGIMMFVCAVSEIPVLFMIRKIVCRLGIRGTLILSGLVTVLRWGLLWLVHDPVLVIPVSLLHGLGYTGISYCLVTYIGKSIPREMRATGQTLNALISNACSRIVFGFLGGLASDFLGVSSMMMINMGIMAITVLIFTKWSTSQRSLAKGA